MIIAFSSQRTNRHIFVQVRYTVSQIWVKILLELIEVQAEAYLGEEDIRRV